MRISLSYILLFCTLFVIIQGCLFNANDSTSREYIISVTVDKVVPVDQIEVTRVIDGDTTLLIFDVNSIDMSVLDSANNSYRVTVPLKGKSVSEVELFYTVKSRGVIVLTNEHNFQLAGEISASTQKVDSLIIDLLKQYHRKKQLANVNNSDSTHLENVRTFNSNLFSALIASRMRIADTTQARNLYNAYKSNEKNMNGSETAPDTLRLLGHIRDTLTVHNLNFPEVLGYLYSEGAPFTSLIDSLPLPKERDPLSQTWLFPVGAKGTVTDFKDTVLFIDIVIIKETEVLETFRAEFDKESGVYSVKAGVSFPGVYFAEMRITNTDSLLSGWAGVQFTEKDTLITFPEISALNAEPWITVETPIPLSIMDSFHVTVLAGDSIGGNPVVVSWSIDSVFHDIAVPIIAPNVPNDSQMVVMRVTDSDFNSVFDTVYVSVLLDAPTVVLTSPDSIIDLADSVRLNWAGSDHFGSIIQYSVRPIEGATIADWIDVGLDTTISFEHLTTDGVFRYMLRAMDDDGVLAFDTVTLTKIIDPPVVEKVALVGTASQNGALKVVYTYHDVLGDVEGTTQFQWFRGTDSIQGAIDSLYTPVYADSGAVLSCLVTPVALTGYQKVGLGVLGSVTGKVTGFNVPVADSVSIIGSHVYATLHTVSYLYSDVDEDAEGTSGVQWFRDAAPIVGQNDSTYLPTEEDVGHMLSVSVTPISLSGTVLSGVAHLSEEILITGQLPVPAISLVGGVFTEPQDVTIDVSVIGAAIHYTLDGSDPDATSPLYTEALSIAASATLRVRLIKTGWTASAVVFQSYTITGTVEEPVFSVAPGSYATAQPVEITSETSGVEIRFTTDGSEPSVVSQLYTGAVAVTTSQKIRARAFKVNWLPSVFTEAEYIILGTVSLPSVSPVGGTYTAAVSVTLSSNIDQTEIYYTTDGSEPTKSTALYSAPFEVAASATVQARAYRDGWVESSIVSQSYVITGTVATPTVDNTGGVYTASISVVLQSNTPGAVIKYTTDGTIPTASSPVYTNSIPIPSTTTLTARAFKADWIDSEVLTHTYTITGTLAAPSVDIPGRTSATELTVSANAVAPQITIRYTTDLSDPDESSPVLSSLLISSSTTLKMRAFRLDWISSSVTTEFYTITGSLALPQVSESGGTYTSARSITITHDNNLATLYYTLDGSVPTESDTEYTGPISITATKTLRARAYLASWTPSNISAHTYVITGQVTTPLISPAGTTHSTTQTVEISGVNVGAVIYYTTNGAVPTQSSSIYSAPFILNTSATIRARAFLTDWDPSTIATVSYELIVPVPTASQGGGTFQDPISVTLSSATGSTIYYTEDGSTPSTGSSLYSTPLSVSTSRTIRFIATRLGWSSSSVIDRVYVITGTAQAPTISLDAGQYNDEQSITVTPVSGTTVYYTTDGSTPTESDTEATGTMSVTKSDFYRFRAFRSGWTPSNVIDRNYELIVPTPSATVSASAATSISVSASASIGTLRLTWSAGTPSDPTESSTEYSSGFSVTSTRTYKYKAFRTGWTSSATVTETYTINGQAAPPSPTSGGSAATSITVNVTAPAGTIRYTFSASGTPSNPTSSSSVWSNRTITSSTDGTYKFAVFRTNYEMSNVITETYTINGQLPAPKISNTIGAAWAREITVTASSGATIWYSFNGSSWTQYVKPFWQSCTSQCNGPGHASFRTYTTRTNWEDSEVVSEDIKL